MNRIILADNQGVFRAGAAKLLSMEDDMRVIAQCKDLDSFRASLVHQNCTVILGSSMQVVLPDIMLKLYDLRSRVVVILEVGEDDEPYRDAGAQGVVSRSVSGLALVDTVRRVGNGERVVRTLAKRTAENEVVGRKALAALSPKELQIVAYLSQGLKNKEIAIRLRTTEQVIKNCLRTVYDKTGAGDRLEMALFVFHHPVLARATQSMLQDMNYGGAA